MLDDIQKFLERVGFSEREARIYLALLVTGESSAQELAERVSVPRPTCYDALESLKVRGFISEQESDHGRRFRAETPERLRDILELQVRELVIRQREAEAVLPRLAALHQRAASPFSVRYLRGHEAFMQLQMEIENLEGDILQLVGYDAFLAMHDQALSVGHRERLAGKQRKVRAILITRRSPASIVVPEGVEVRIIPPEVVTSTGEMVVCEDRLMCFGYDGEISVLDIRSPAIVSAARATLELAWRQAGAISSIML